MRQARSRTLLVYNGASGSHDDAALAELADALGDAGSRPEQVLDCHDGTPSAREADAAGWDTVVIHGGDGTINRTLARLEGFSGRLLTLPGGTFNLFCRELFGERTPLEIVGLLAAGDLALQRRTCIRGEGILALTELLAGPGATWADVREELREGNIGEVLAKGWDAAAMSTVGPMVHLERPVAGRAEGYAGIRLCPQADTIAISGYGAEGLGDYIQQGVAILKRDFREGPHDDLGAAREVLCRADNHAPIALMVDGERSEGSGAQRFYLAPFDADLLGPANGR
ncbi:MAG: diacylglycerol kinase family protein [Tsuneonella sp.]